MKASRICSACGRPIFVAVLAGALISPQFVHACDGRDAAEMDFSALKIVTTGTGTSFTSSLLSTFTVEGSVDGVTYEGFYRAERPDRGAAEPPPHYIRKRSV
jgi:hypothetical protein